MAVKKVTKSAAAPKATAAKKAPVKRAAKAEIFVDAENAGFRAGDVYQALSAQNAPMSVEELVKATGKTSTEILLGIGWLLKEMKIKGDNGKVVLA